MDGNISKRGIFGDLHLKRRQEKCMGSAITKISSISAYARAGSNAVHKTPLNTKPIYSQTNGATSLPVSSHGTRTMADDTSACQQNSDIPNCFPKMHTKARCSPYPRTTDVMRASVTDDKVSWDVEYPEYNPITFTSEGVLKLPVWADIDLLNEPENGEGWKWNKIDGKINRTSHQGKYEVVDNLPRNPVGRTGVRGRGCLGRWGPNHAADPIVTRWKKDDDGNKVCSENGQCILQFVSVQRRDNKQWAIPGGMVDAGEVITETLKREFGEEAMNTLEMSDEQLEETKQSIDQLFREGKVVYRGYVDDPRNTDNAWMETVALNFHDDEGTSVSNIQLQFGDDAVGVQWMDMNSNVALYASHSDFLEKVARRHNAFW